MVFFDQFSKQYFQSASLLIVFSKNQGRLLLDNNFTSSATFNQNIQLNNAQAGVYLLTVTDGERKQIKKIVVE